MYHFVIKNDLLNLTCNNDKTNKDNTINKSLFIILACRFLQFIHSSNYIEKLQIDLTEEITDIRLYKSLLYLYLYKIVLHL